MPRLLLALLVFLSIASAPAQAVEAPFIVVVDPGHGGRDPGAVGVSGRTEKSVTLLAGRLLAERLSALPGIIAVMSRTDDRYVSLAGRLHLVASLEADLLVSLHADSLPSRPDLRGASVYTLAAAPSSPEAARKARRENAEDRRLEALDAVADDAVQAILTALMRTFTTERSGRLARAVVAELRPVTRLLSRPHLGADFVVLRSLQTPSVLIELGYLSNVADERLLGDRRHLEGLAGAIASAVARELAQPRRHVVRTTARSGPAAASRIDR